MKILSVDPGYGRVGVSVIEKQNGKEILLYSTCIETSPKDSFPKRLVEIGGNIKKIIKEYSPEKLAIETLLFNTNQKTVMKVSEARGMIIYISANAGLDIHEYTPLQIKTAVCGYGRATKEQVATMTEKLISIPRKIKYDDEMDAIAIGLTCFASVRMK